MSDSEDDFDNPINIQYNETASNAEIKKEIFNISETEDDYVVEETQHFTIEHDIDKSVEEMYNCKSCDMNFHSVMEHVKKYHPDQEVVVEVDDQETADLARDDYVTFDQITSFKNEPNEEVDPLFEENYETEYLEDDDININELSIEKINNVPQKNKYKETITEEECVDKDGRFYKRKIVKIEKFWEGSVEKSSSEPKKTVSEVVYLCQICLSEYPTSRALSAHSRVHKTQQVPAASTTTTTTTSDPQTNDVLIFECSTCNTVFASNKSLRLHVRMHDPIKPKTLDDSMDYDYLINPGEERPIKSYFKCEVCEKVYDKKFETVHMHMHSDDPKYNCIICNKKFTNEINLKMHIKAHQEYKVVKSKNDDLANPLPYACAYCGRQFSRPHEKVKHERIHTGEKPHSCDVCGKTFRVSYCLTLHMRTHSGARPYVCPHCNKRFKAHSVYNHHLMTHSDVRAYQCTFCPKAFKTSVQLAGHRNSHTKPFSCTECNRPFATLYAVRSHMENHKKPNHNLKHKCSICGATYARSFALRDHVKEHHSAELGDGNIITINVNLPKKEDNEEEEEDEDEIINSDEDKSILPDDNPEEEDEHVTLSEYDHFETEEVVTIGY